MRGFPMRRVFVASMSLAMLGLSAGRAAADSYLFVDMGLPTDKPATYIAIATSPVLPDDDPESRKRVTRDFLHLPLEPQYSLLPMEPGRYWVSHFDFGKTITGDHESMHLRREVEFEVHENAVHFLGTETFSDAEVDDASLHRALTNLCSRFPDQASTSNLFYFLLSTHPPRVTRFRCALEEDGS